MKILTTQATARIVAGHSPEYEVFRKIESANPNSPGFGHCLALRHCFTAKSAAGGHICFVTDALSSSLANLRAHEHGRFTLPIAKRITKQVLLALDYLHRECGYIHTGGSDPDPAPTLIHSDDHMLRSQIREHSYFNTSTSSFSNR
jgi:serine/threonine-protein kinase SRPK3